MKAAKAPAIEGKDAAFHAVFLAVSLDKIAVAARLLAAQAVLEVEHGKGRKLVRARDEIMQKAHGIPAARDGKYDFFELLKFSRVYHIIIIAQKRRLRKGNFHMIAT